MIVVDQDDAVVTGDNRRQARGAHGAGPLVHQAPQLAAGRRVDADDLLHTGKDHLATSPELGHYRRLIGDVVLDAAEDDPAGSEVEGGEGSLVAAGLEPQASAGSDRRGGEAVPGLGGLEVVDQVNLPQ